MRITNMAGLVIANLGALIGHGLWLEQLKAVGLTLALSVGGTAVIACAIKAILGLRPSLDAEEAGLDDTDHGEAGYHPDEGGHGGRVALNLPTLEPSRTLETASTAT